jgi:RNA polymerase sigma-70 factor (ECF subfamily)
MLGSSPRPASSLMWEVGALNVEDKHRYGHDGALATSTGESSPAARDASDVALVIGVARRDQDALAELYRRHGGAVLALARRVLVDRTLAGEIVQEVFVRLWNAPERFDPARGSLRSFLLTQAHRRSVDLVRSESSRRVRETGEAANFLDLTGTSDDEMTDPATAGHVRTALAALGESERAAIELAYFGGYSYREVADRLRTPEGTVKSRIRSGLRKLRASLVAAGVDRT